jgi:hypothetical protein
MSGAWIAVIVTQWIIIIALCLVCVGILRYLAVFRERMELAAPTITALSIGEAVPELEFTELATQAPFTLTRGRSCLLLFLSSTCSGCRHVLAQMDELTARGRQSMDTQIALVFVDEVLPEALVSWPHLDTDSGLHVLRDPRSLVPELLGVWSLPTAVLVDKRGRVEDQSPNPHAANWIYRALSEEVPQEEKAEAGWMPIGLPKTSGPKPIKVTSKPEPMDAERR